MAPDRADDAASPDDDTVVRAPVEPARPPSPDFDDTITTSARPVPEEAAPAPGGTATRPLVPLVIPAPAPARAQAPARPPARPSARPPVPSAVPAAPAPAPAAPAPVPAPIVRLPDGSSLELDGGTVYVGRKPALPRVPAAGVPRLVTLPSPRREVSSTHLAISVVGDAVVVRDMLSTNGTVVKAPGAPARTLLRGESAVVTPGTTLDLGDGNVLEVRS